MSAGRYSRGRQESTTFQDTQLTSSKRFAWWIAAAAVCRRRKASTRRMRVGDGRWQRLLHSPGRIVRAARAAHRLQPFHDTYLIGPSRLWPGGTPFKNTACQNHACRCRPPVRERRRAYRPSVPVAGGMMRSKCGDEDERGRIFSEVTEKEGGAARNCARHSGRSRAAPLTRPFGPPFPRRVEDNKGQPLAPHQPSA